MTLIKSILLGSAAGIVAVAGAQAADLPTHKAAPVVEYVKICNVGGIVGWTLPGSDTCLKLSGYITGQVQGGNLNTQYNFASVNAVAGAIATTNPALAATLGAFGAAAPLSSQRVLLAASDTQGNTTFFRNEVGWTTRANFAVDTASNTAYGPLLGHMEIQGDLGSGFESLEGGLNVFYVNTAYLTWAGLTVGKAQSFFSFTGGGLYWPNFFSPDQKGFNEPILFAYTASFGGGFSATLAAQSSGTEGYSGGGTDIPGPNNTYGGERWPDIVGALHVKQGWGEAQVSGVLHDVNVAANGVQGSNGFPAALGGTGGCDVAALAITGSLATCDSQKTLTGWGIDAGVSFNLPQFGAGDVIGLTGAYTKNAVWFSGIPDGMWGENGQVNGNGQPMYVADAYFNPLTNQWSNPTAWSIAGWAQHHFNPQWAASVEASYAELNWSGQGSGCSLAATLLTPCPLAQGVQGALSPRAKSWIVGGALDWYPVTNLNFELELMYQGTTQERPSGFLGTVYNLGGPGGAIFVPGAWQGNSNGFAGRLLVTRNF
jgi:Porin subfamily